MLAVVDLRCQLPDGVMVIGPEAVRLTWRIAPPVPDLVQEACHIQVSPSDDFSSVSFDSGVVEGAEQIAVEAPGGCLASRETRCYRVRIRTMEGWTGWSPTLRVEAGLLHAADWRGPGRGPAG